MFDTLLKRFGEMAVWLGLADPERVAEAVQTQPGAGRRLGEHLGDLGHLDPEKTDTVLQAQRLAREHAAVLRHDLETGVDRSDAAAPVVEFLGVIDGTRMPALPVEQFAPETPLAVSLQGVEYINRAGVEDLVSLWGERPFVLCEVAPLFRLLLEEMGVDVLAPIVATRDEARAKARELADAFAEVAAAHAAEAHPAAAEAAAPVPAVSTRPRPELNLSLFVEGSIGVVSMEGVLAPSTALARRRELAAFFHAHPCNPVVVDFTALESCHLDGLILLGELPAETEIIIAAPPAVRSHLRLLGLTERHAVFDTLDEAIQAAASPYVAVEGRPVFHRHGCRILRHTDPHRCIYLSADGVEERRPCGICLRPAEEAPDAPPPAEGGNR
jgi:anti-anti-sigma regulatory factor